MRECLELHFATARGRLKLFGGMAAVVALVPAAFIGFYVGTFGAFVACAILFSFLTAAMPLAVYYAEIHRVRKLQRRFEGNHRVVASVVHLRLSINGSASERATVQLNTGEQIGLILPAEQITRLCEAYAPR